MPKRSKTQNITDGIAGQHLALSVAAHLARTQLVREPLNVYDSQHLTDMLNFIATALTRVAQLYIVDPQSGVRRELSPEELEGVRVKRGAGVLVLRDGRALGGVTIRRADLRVAIAILKAAGLEGASIPPAPEDRPAGGQVNHPVISLAERFREVEELLKPPLVPAQVERAKKMAVWIARHAPHGRVANLAMQLISALQGAQGTDDTPGGFRMALARLGAVLVETEKVEKSQSHAGGTTIT